MPKFNMYQSLHTTVIGPAGRPLEIQIRTEEMHRTAEYGIAAHWRYKEGGRGDETFDERLAWLRQMLEWQTELKDPREFMEALKIDLFEDEVFVFTPKGDVVTCARAPRPSTSPTRSTPRSAITASARRSTARSSRSATSCRWATASRSSPTRTRGPVARLAQHRQDLQRAQQDPLVLQQGQPHRRPRQGQGRAAEDPAQAGAVDRLLGRRARADRGRQGAQLRRVRRPARAHRRRQGLREAGRRQAHQAARGCRARAGEAGLHARDADAGAALEAQEVRHRRARQGHRRPARAPRALLQPGPGRPARRLRHARARRVGAPRRLPQRARPAQLAGAHHRRRVGLRRLHRPTTPRSTSRRATAPGCCAT